MRVIKVVAVLFLISLELFAGSPGLALLKYVEEKNIVDVMYHTQQSGNVVDAGYTAKVPQAQADGATDAMMVYDTNSSVTTPKFRIWNGSSWGTESSASNFSGELRHVEVKYAPTRDEAIMVAMGNNGEIQAQVFSGSTDTWGSVTVLSTHSNSTGSRDIQSLYRGFDVEYEQSSGDAIVVYGDGSADPNYNVWNGSGWSGGTDINIPTTGFTNWVELASRPGSDELALITLDANADVYGLRWTGAAWNNMGAATTWETSATSAVRKTIDVAFETTSGDIMFMWGTTVTTADRRYRAYSGGALSAVTALLNGNAGGQPNWIKLAANPTSGSNEIMLGDQDAGGDLNTNLWSGTAWDAVHAEHDDAVENIVDMNFDIVFETHASNANDAWLVWGNDLTVSRKLWDGPTDVWAAATTSDDDTSNIRLNAHPNSGAVIGMIYDNETAANDDLREINMTGGTQTWSASTSTWGGPVARPLGLFRMSSSVQGYNASTEAMMVYDAQDIESTPKYRRWTGAAWSAEGSASTVEGQIRHMTVKFSPTSDEGLLVTLGSTGLLQSQEWNGSTWGTPETLSTMNNANGSTDNQSLYRGFDIEYENVSGDAVIVYGDSTADPNYRVWNGSVWSSATDINIPTAGRVHWIEMASRPGSDELAFISEDSAADTYGQRWTGSAWNNMGTAATWDGSSAPVVRKPIDVAFENTSGDILFVWGDATAATHWMYRTYSGGTLSAVTALPNANQAGATGWIKLATNPTAGSNEIMLGSQDIGNDLNTARWSGSAWSAIDAEHTAGAEDAADMNFDIVYETHTSNPNVAWLVYGDGATVSRKRWDGASWAAATTSGDDTARVVLNAHPATGALFLAIYEDDGSSGDDIDEHNITGGGSTWSAASDIWTGPVRRNLGSFLVDIASERYIAPAAPTFTLSNYRWYTDSNNENVTDVWGNPDLSENAPITIIPAGNAAPSTATELRLRIALTIATNNLSATSQQFKLQYKAGTDSSCTTGSWTDVGAGGGGSIWRFATSGVTDGTDLTVLKLSAADVLEEYVKSNPSATNHNAASIGQDVEYDFHLEHNSAADATQYSFRVVTSSDVVLSAYTNCPTLTTLPGIAEVMRHGKFFLQGSEQGFVWVN